MTRKFLLALFIGGLLVGAALGQTPPPVNPPVVVPPVVVPPKVDPPVNPPAPVVVPPKVDPPVPVQISGSSNVVCFAYARFDLTGTFSSAGWMVFPDRTTGASVVATDTFNGGKTFLVGGKPGIYELGAWALTPSGVATVQTTFVILAAPTPTPIPGPTPGPVGPPVPVPTPTPDPTAIVSPYWAIGVYDASRPLPATYTDATIGPAISDLGGHWLKFDVHDPSAANTAWMKAAAKSGAPVLVFVRSDGSVHSVTPLPADAAGIVAAAKSARGQR